MATEFWQSRAGVGIHIDASLPEEEKQKIFESSMKYFWDTWREMNLPRIRTITLSPEFTARLEIEYAKAFGK